MIKLIFILLFSSCAHKVKKDPLYTFVINDNAPPKSNTKKQTTSRKKKKQKVYKPAIKSTHKIKIFETVRSGFVDITEANLKRESVDTRDPENGDTLVIYAIKANRIDQVFLLLKKGANLKLKNNAGDDAIATAKKFKRKRILRLITRFKR